ncbi:MAG: hypothetical protein N2109_04925 [Fimbriimonadales bacterium]|nr:hypothetical protein [Fimbriimonadales bacterium]
MPLTLLVGGPGDSFRELRKEHPDAPWLCLDPADPDTGLLGRIALQRQEGWLWRFYGSLNPLRSPHVVLGALAELLPLLGGEGFVRLFPWRRAPLARELALVVDRLVRPDRIVCADPDALQERGWSTGPQTIELPNPFPQVVVQAQRRAHWHALLSRATLCELPLNDTLLMGARIGSGSRLDAAALSDAGVRAVWAERTEGTLYLVCEQPPGDEALRRAAQNVGCDRSEAVPTERFAGLLCGLARLNGDDFALGVLQGIDFKEGTIRVWTDAVPPVSAPILKLGGLRLDAKGAELGELRPWQV